MPAAFRLLVVDVLTAQTVTEKLTKATMKRLKGFDAAAGGKWVVLSPEGFHERWHPGRRYERYCAEGRMLFLSLYPMMDRLPTKQELYQRCHEMGDIVVNGL